MPASLTYGIATVPSVPGLQSARAKLAVLIRPDGAMTYDPRLMSFKGLDTVSLLTLDGRALVPLIYGKYQRERFDRLLTAEGENHRHRRRVVQPAFHRQRLDAYAETMVAHAARFRDRWQPPRSSTSPRRRAP